MHELVVAEGTLTNVNTQVRAAVEDVGGVVSEQAMVRTRFDHLRPGGETFSRSGYVGVYQTFGSKQVNVRVRLWAHWPRRLVHLILVVGFVLTLILLGARPDPTAWFWAAVFSWGGLGVAFLFYASTWEVTRGLEARLAKEIADRIEDATGQSVWTPDEWDERIERLDQAAKQKVRVIRGKAKADHIAAHASASDAEPGSEPAKRRFGRRAKPDATTDADDAGDDAAPAEPRRKRFGRRTRDDAPATEDGSAAVDAKEDEGVEGPPRKGLRARLGRAKAGAADAPDDAPVDEPGTDEAAAKKGGRFARLRRRRGGDGEEE